MFGVEVLQIQQNIARVAELPLEGLDQAEGILAVQVAGHIEDIAEHENVARQVEVLARINSLLFQTVDNQRNARHRQFGDGLKRMPAKFAGYPDFIHVAVQMMPVRTRGWKLPQPVADVVSAFQQIGAIGVEESRQHVGVLQQKVDAVRLEFRQGALGHRLRPTRNGDFVEWNFRGLDGSHTATRNRSKTAYGVEESVKIDAVGSRFQQRKILRTIRNCFPRPTAAAFFSSE